MEQKQVVGVDIAKLKFDVCAVFEGKTRKKVFLNNTSGFEGLISWITNLGLGNPHFCMEATGCYSEGLSEFLFEKNLKVSVVNPLQMKRFRESKMVRQKTDSSDSEVIALFCLQNNTSLWEPKPLENKELYEVNQAINNLKNEMTRITNRLEKTYRNKVIKALMNKRIFDLKSDIEKLSYEAKRIINSSEKLKENYANLTGIKGIGERAAISILSEMPNVENFESAKQYAAFAGVTPSHYESGTSVKGKSRISRMGSRKVRKTLYMVALVVKRFNPFFKPFCDRLAAKNKPPKVIIVAVMRKLMHIIFGMLKNNQQFDKKLAFSS
jgi:transposase